MKLRTWLATHWFLAGLIILIILSVVLRFYKLADVPHGMTWDEAAIGYDGYAVWTAHRDEWMKVLPISFKSFGDYKAPLAIYVTGLFEVILGVNLWVVRLPFALGGVLAVVGMVFLTRQLLKLFSKLDQKNIDLYSLLAGVGLSLSPWHLHLSRIGMESGMALTLVVWGIYFLLKYVEFQNFPERLKLQNFKFLNRPLTWLLAAAFTLVMSLYAYHSAKLATPLLLLLFAVVSRKTLFKKVNEIVKAAILGVVLVAPLVADAVIGHGSDRLSQALIPIAGRTPWQISYQLLQNLAIHFSPAFLVGGLTPVLRHGDGVWGVLLWPVFLLAVLGIIALVYFALARKSRPKLLLLAIISLLWILIGYIPAVIGWEVPHANRTLLALPGWIWLAVVGWDALTTFATSISSHSSVRGSHGETNLLPKTISGLVILSSALFFIKYQHHYYTQFAAQSASDFQDGYNELYADLKPYFYNDPSVPGTDKILFSTEYGQAYIFALFNYKISPVAFNQGALNKIEYDETRFVNGGSLMRPKTVVVATKSNDMPWDKANKIIYGSDGSIRFGIFVNPNNQ